MTSLDTQLWELIETHKMPDDAAGKPFVEQLMADNKISLDTANVAIAEYRKFLYLCATRPERNVPSNAVDLVWHLHMQHSRDYWDGFCKKLGKPIHHTPGTLGTQHLDDYKATVRAYRDLFGTPPKGIWKLNNRFGAYTTLIVLVGFFYLGAREIAQDGNVLFGVVWLSALLLILLNTLNSLTTKGEFTLIFDSSDPFANDDAGDCGSGDGGGCGD